VILFATLILSLCFDDVFLCLSFFRYRPFNPEVGATPTFLYHSLCFSMTGSRVARRPSQLPLFSSPSLSPTLKRPSRNVQLDHILDPTNPPLHFPPSPPPNCLVLPLLLLNQASLFGPVLFFSIPSWLPFSRWLPFCLNATADVSFSISEACSGLLFVGKGFVPASRPLHPDMFPSKGRSLFQFPHFLELTYTIFLLTLVLLFPMIAFNSTSGLLRFFRRFVCRGS